MLADCLPCAHSRLFDVKAPLAPACQAVSFCSPRMIKCQGAAGCKQEQAFVHKYPVRDPSGWQDKALKYKPNCSSDAYDIAMGPLVSVISIVCTAFFHHLPKLLCKQGMFTCRDQSKACHYKYAVCVSFLASCALSCGPGTIQVSSPNKLANLLCHCSLAECCHGTVVQVSDLHKLYLKHEVHSRRSLHM